MPPDRRVTAEEQQLWQEVTRPDAPLPLSKAADMQTRRRQRAVLQEKPPMRLDLHGFTLTEAHNALLAYITAAHAARLPEVVIITGKGSHSPAGQATLRTEVPRWLGVPPLVSKIRRLGELSPNQGGRGALKVFLR